MPHTPEYIRSIVLQRIQTHPRGIVGVAADLSVRPDVLARLVAGNATRQGTLTLIALRLGLLAPALPGALSSMPQVRT